MMKREESSNDFEKLANYHNHQKEKTNHIKKLFINSSLCIACLTGPYVIRFATTWLTVGKPVQIVDIHSSKSCSLNKNDSKKQMIQQLKEQLKQADENHILSDESIDASLLYVEKNPYLDPCDISKKINHLKVYQSTPPLSDIGGLTVKGFHLPFSTEMIIIKEGLASNIKVLASSHELIHYTSRSVPILEEGITSYFNSFLTEDVSSRQETTMLRMLIEVTGIDPILKADATGSLKPIIDSLYEIFPNRIHNYELIHQWENIQRAKSNKEITKYQERFLSLIDDYYIKKHGFSFHEDEMMQLYQLQLDDPIYHTSKDYLFGTPTKFTIGTSDPFYEDEIQTLPIIEHKKKK